MELKFATELLSETVKEEYEDLMEDKHIGKMDRILEIIKSHGFHKVNKKDARKIENDIYEIKPGDRRVIYIKIVNNQGIILKTYIKKTQKMPKNILKTVRERAKIIRNSQ